MRQEHVPPLPQPHERPHRRRARCTGRCCTTATDLYGPKVDPVEVRRRIGMVFQKPNPFPKSIFDNVAFGPRLNGKKRGLDDVVEEALTRAALWDEVKDKLKESAFALSGGQQQRLCIARCIAVEPDVDPDGRAVLGARSDRDREDRGPHGGAEARLHDRDRDPQHAAGRARRPTAPRSSPPMCDDGGRIGHLVEFDVTEKLFTAPSDPRTEGYITGRFG